MREKEVGGGGGGGAEGEMGCGARRELKLGN